MYITLQASIVPELCTKDFYINVISYQAHADQWIRTYIVDSDGNLLIHPKELQTLANLIYISYQRSYMTLEAQTIALKTLESIWHGWQNIAQTRLDPSIQTPYEIMEIEKRHTIIQFWQSYDMQQQICQAYNTTIQHVIYGDCLFTKKASESVADLRQQAKAVVAQSLVDARKYVGQLFYQTKSLKRGFSKIMQFADYLYSYLPKLAINSFVEANKTNDIVSENSWAVLLKIQNVGKKTWQIIEQERAAFYLVFYKKIWDLMNYLNLENTYKKVMFNAFDIITPENQYDYLPDPRDLYPTPHQ